MNFDKIIIHLVTQDLKERGLSRNDFNQREWLKLLYDMSLKLLAELGK